MQVEARGLGKSFGNRRAVDDLNFTIRPGVVTGFLGPNGSGKSTTLRLMLQLDRGQGETLFDGRPLKAHGQISRVVGAHLDAKLYHPQRTAVNHLRMLAAESNLSNQRVDQIIDLMGLSDVAGKRPKTFSLGMAQRLGLAGAILGDPQVLFLDEPANGLDPATIHWLRDFLKHYASLGRCVFVSSHLLSEMELMADELVVIARGRLIANESIGDFVNRGMKNQIQVRVDQPERLVGVLNQKGFSSHPVSDNWVEVTSPDTDTVGHIAFESGVRVLELKRNRASLEETFLALTDDKQEFETGGAK
jgi:ABC-2 type transport system ATP-binding protein